MLDMDKKVIVSMTTIPVRKVRLIENLPSLLGQSYYFDKLVINVDDNLSEDDYKFYHTLTEIDSRIEINKSENEMYGEKMLENIKSKPTVFFLDKDNVQTFIYSLKYLKMIYQYGILIDFGDLTKNWIKEVKEICNI